MTDIYKPIRDFAQAFIDAASEQTAKTGTAGATTEITQSGVARQLLALLDSLPALTSDEMRAMVREVAVTFVRMAPLEAEPTSDRPRIVAELCDAIADRVVDLLRSRS